jgi:hypothetical protein
MTMTNNVSSKDLDLELRSPTNLTAQTVAGAGYTGYVAVFDDLDFLEDVEDAADLAVTRALYERAGAAAFLRLDP